MLPESGKFGSKTNFGSSAGRTLVILIEYKTSVPLAKTGVLKTPYLHSVSTSNPELANVPRVINDTITMLIRSFGNCIGIFISCNKLM